MPTPRENNIWGNIRVQLGDAQNLILNGKYAEAAMLNQKILKTIVRMQIDKACLVTNTLGDDIDQLYNGRLISSRSRENYQQIRAYGEQAEAGSAFTAQMANDSFNMIREELGTYVDNNQSSFRAFAGQEGAAVSARTGAESGAGLRGTENRTSAQRNRYTAPAGGGLDIPMGSRRDRQTEESSTRRSDRRAEGGREAGTGSGSRTSTRRGTSSRTGRLSGRSAGSGLRSSRTGSGRVRSGRNLRDDEPMEIDLYSILKIAIPVACVILVIILIKILTAGGKTEIATTAATVTESVVETEAPTMPETTVPETTQAVSTTWITTKGVKVREAPNTNEGTRALAVLEEGTTVEYQGDYDDNWIIINYEGTQAYIAKQYVKPVEESTTAAAETATAATSAAASTTSAGTVTTP